MVRLMATLYTFPSLSEARSRLGVVSTGWSQLPATRTVNATRAQRSRVHHHHDLHPAPGVRCARQRMPPLWSGWDMLPWPHALHADHLHYIHRHTLLIWLLLTSAFFRASHLASSHRYLPPTLDESPRRATLVPTCVALSVA